MALHSFISTISSAMNENHVSAMILAVDVCTAAGDGSAQRGSWPQGGGGSCVGAPSTGQCCRSEAGSTGLHHIAHTRRTHLSIALCLHLQHTQPSPAVLGCCGGWVSPELSCLCADQCVLKCFRKTITEKRKPISCPDLSPYDYLCP